VSLNFSHWRFYGLACSFACCPGCARSSRLVGPGRRGSRRWPPGGPACTHRWPHEGAGAGCQSSEAGVGSPSDATESEFKYLDTQRFYHERDARLFPLFSNQLHIQFDNLRHVGDKAFRHRISLLTDWEMVQILSSQFSPSLGR
jgi:hypothetical protein